MSAASGSFYGKYRGTVTDNLDPLMQGRIRARVPAVLVDNDTGWALPSAPYGGKGVGFFFVPPVGANVWMEFEGGNTDSPIWSGCFWGIGEAPTNPPLPDFKVLKTDFATITILDTPGAGSITIESKTPPMKIVLNAIGIELSNGNSSVKLTTANVSINNGALEVT